MLQRKEMQEMSEEELKNSNLVLQSFTRKGITAYIYNDLIGEKQEMNCNFYYHGIPIEYIAYPDYVVNIHDDLYRYTDYIYKQIDNKVFSEKELEDVSDYFDYDKKRDFCNNIFPQFFDSISIFDSEKELKEKGIDKEDYKYHGNICNLYKYLNDANYVREKLKHLDDLYNKKILGDKAQFRKAVLHEMYNHESPIDWDGFEPALRDMGLSFKTLTPEYQEIVLDAFSECRRNGEW